MSLDEDVKLMTGLGLETNLDTIERDGVFYYHRGLQNGSAKAPVLLLIHGYPQTNFMWRHLIPLLPKEIPLFIPDIPGYGRSLPLQIPHSKTNQSRTLLGTLNSLLPSTTKVPLIIAGHDRGARICHRLAVDNPSPNLPVLGAIFLDIVPTLVQWKSFSSPTASRRAYHWAFLAQNDIAVPMIMALGGDNYIRSCISRWVGRSPSTLAKFESDNSLAIYSRFFTSRQNIEATCDDYRAGAQEDIEEQVKDQKDGRKIDIDVLAVYSQSYLGSRYDCKAVWEEWISGKGSLECLGVEGVGHFLAEERPEGIAGAVVGFWEKHTSTA